MIEYIKITNQILDFKAIQCTNIPEKVQFLLYNI